MGATLAIEDVRPRPVGRPTRAARDVREQRRYDVRRGLDYPQLEVRYKALLEAALAADRGEVGATFAERQALIDLASCAEEMAQRRPAPTALSAA